MSYEELEQDDKTVDYRALVKSEDGTTTIDLSLFPKSEANFSGLLAS